MTYASVSDLITYGLPATALGALSPAQQNAALESASKVVDSYLRGRYALPLTAWGSEITEATCRIAAYNLLNVRGYNSAAGADENIAARYEQTILWLRDVQRQAAHPDVTPQASQTPNYDQPTVISSSVTSLATGATARNRGW